MAVSQKPLILISALSLQNYFFRFRSAILLTGTYRNVTQMSAIATKCMAERDGT